MTWRKHDHIMRAKDDYRPIKVYQDLSMGVQFYRKWICTYRGCRHHEMRIVNDYELHIKGVIR